MDLLTFKHEFRKAFTSPNTEGEYGILILCHIIHRNISPSRKHTYIVLTPLNPTFYTVKLVFAGVYNNFLFLVKPLIVGTR